MTEYIKESIIDDLASQVYDKKYTLGTRRATDWMIRELKGMAVNRNQLMRDNERLTPQLFLGNMFFYFYDPKWKNKLPYYDTFPLGIPIKIHKKGFDSLNLHYLSPRHRLEFLKELLVYTNNSKLDETTRFQLKYKLLDNVSRLDAFRPCYKSYLWTHVRSQFLTVQAQDWYIVPLLPVAAFHKAPEGKVWRDSRMKIKHG